MTVNELLNLGRQILAVDTNSESDPEALLGHLLDIGTAQIIARGNQAVSDQRCNLYLGLIRRRQQGEPVAYLTGSREFWSLPLNVDSRVLVPRHETETLVECCLSVLGNQQFPDILDLGTGSGAVALALSKELPNAKIVATDVFEEALEVTGLNCRSLGLQNIEIVQSNWFEKIGSSKFHLICSNPPYIASGDPHLESPELGFEPLKALVSGPEGLDDLSRIVKDAGSYLHPYGYLAVEHGFEQGVRVRRLFSDCGYQEIRTIQDLGGNERVTVGQSPG